MTSVLVTGGAGFSPCSTGDVCGPVPAGEWYKAHSSWWQPFQHQDPACQSCDGPRDAERGRA